jgi:hypothetical protein
MTHFAEDIQFFIILAGGGSLTALATSRVKYGKDWYDPWLIMTEVVGSLSVVGVAINEWSALYTWWFEAPIVASSLILSFVGWGFTALLRRSKAQPSYVDLGLDTSEMSNTKRKVFSWPLALWGALNVTALLYSLAR